MKKAFIILTVFAALAAASSCADKLDVTPPNKITEEQIKDLLENGSAAQKQAILTSIVTPMVGYFNQLDRDNVSCNGSADVMNNATQGLDWGRSLLGNDVASGYDLDSYDLAGSRLYKFETDFRMPSGNVNYAHWAEYAYAINQANNVLSYMTAELAQGDNLYKDGRARALLVRGYSYMCMMEEYQDAYLLGGKDKLGLPLYTEFNPLQPSVERSTSVATWDFIMKDIKEAKSLLSATGIGYTAGRNNSEDIDMGVVNFVLARAALLTGDWATCETACKEIINSGAYSFIKAENYGGHNTGEWSPTSSIVMAAPANAFTNIGVNPETILGFKVGSSYYNNSSNFFSLASAFGSYAQLKSIARIDDRLYDKIPANDFRKDAFRKEEVGDYKYAGGNVGYIPSYTAFKFACTDGLTNDGGSAGGSATDVPKCDYTKMRLSEVYLMLAEALCNSNKTNEAKTYMDALLAARTKTGAAAALTTDAFGTNMLDVVKLNWRIEMWGEQGREYYNNKRWGVDVDRTGSKVHPVIAKWPANKMTLQIPERELQDNNQCVKNDIL